MSITLKQVTQRSAGGDIVRTQEIKTAEPVIGRGTECAIQLPDLAVSLRHAILHHAAPGLVSIKALKGFSFDVGGKSVTQTELRVSENPKANFGNHTLEFTSGADQDELVITVTRLADEQDAGIDARQAIFSLRSAMFSRRATAYCFAVAILLICLFAPIAAFYFDPQQARIDPDQQWSSGPLSIGHAFLEDDCQACHQQAFVAIRDDICLTCHQAGLNETASVQLANEIKAAGSPFAPRPAANHAQNDLLLSAKPVSADIGSQITAFLQRAFDHPSERCSDCHVEHVGYGRQTNAATVSPHPIDVGDLALSDCTLCHSAMQNRLANTELRDVIDWDQHPEFRPTLTVAIEAEQPQLERIALSQFTTENSGLTFPHDLHSSTTGGVARMAISLGDENGYGTPLSCASCHRPDEEYRGFLAIEMERDCAACHSLAFANNGNEIRTLPHGEPDRVVTTVQEFYASTNFDEIREYLSRRRPGVERVAWTTGLVEGPFPASATEMINVVFSEGGSCFGCHAILEPVNPETLGFNLTPVQLTERFLPFGGFDHGVVEHHEDADGSPTCTNCHAADSSEDATDVMLPMIATCQDCHGTAVPLTAAAAPIGSTPGPITLTATPDAHVTASAECTQCHGYHTTGAPVVSFRERN